MSKQEKQNEKPKLPDEEPLKSELVQLSKGKTSKDTKKEKKIPLKGKKK